MKHYLPTSVQVGRRRVPVHRRKLVKLQGTTNRRRILLDADLGKFSSLSVLIHEMLHVVDWRLSEARVLQLEYALVSLVLANPDLFKSLAKQAPRRRP